MSIIAAQSTDLFTGSGMSRYRWCGFPFLHQLRSPHFSGWKGIGSRRRSRSTSRSVMRTFVVEVSVAADADAAKGEQLPAEAVLEAIGSDQLGIPSTSWSKSRVGPCS